MIFFRISFISALIILCSADATFGQSYFQQKCDYIIKAKLDTVQRTLDVQCKLSYTNNSNVALDHIYFHVWWNSFQNKSSAFAAQRLQLGMRDFYFAKEEALGGYQRLEFYQGTQELLYDDYIDEDNKSHQDVVRVDLNEQIEPGQTKLIEISYVVKIPTFFSRGGLQEDLYRFTQWYPKPAVYDNEGWHPMPYLDAGEFYSEYGDYEVELELPQGFDFVSTGSEDSRDSKMRELVNIKADNVLDFAWFCSDRFVKKTSEVVVGDKKIPIYLFTNFEEDHEVVLQYIKDALIFYSEEVGTYPYPQYSQVLSNSDDQGGMEYPMLSVVDLAYVGQGMDNLIAHEIGHNWFQSAIGTNERQYPWMDEGFNSYVERKYNDSKYEVPNYNWILPRFYRPAEAEYTVLEAGVCHLHCCNKLRKIDQPSGDVDMITYGTNSYERMAFSLAYLESYLGDKLMKKALQSYFSNWAHRHPQPSDLKAVFEQETQKDLSWFFDGVVDSEAVFDYSLDQVQENRDLLELNISNAEDLDIPVHITAYQEGKISHNQWVEINQQTDKVTIPAAEYNRISINGETPFLDVNRRNNHYHPGKLFSKAPLNFRFIGQQKNSYQRTISYLPTLGVNNYDGLMLGMNFHNEFFPYNSTRWHIQPSYGLRSNSLAGVFAIEKDIIERNNPRTEKLTFGLRGRRFAFRNSVDRNRDDVILHYTKLEPSVTWHLNNGLINKSSIDFRVHYISLDQTFVEEKNNSTIFQLNYRSLKQQPIYLTNTLWQLEYEPYRDSFGENHSYLKFSLEKRWKVHYSEKHRFEVCFFGGYFIQNSKRESASYTGSTFTKGSFALTQQGFTDHTYEGYYYGRSEQLGGFSRQMYMEEGGFKMPLGSAYTFDLSNNYLLSLNLKADLPYSILGVAKFKPFVDLGYLENRANLGQEASGKFLYSTGLALEFGEVIGIYLPLLYSPEFDIPFAGRSLSQKLSFKIDVNKLNLWRIAEDPGVFIR